MIETLTAIPTIVSSLIATVTTLWGAWNQLRAGRLTQANSDLQLGLHTIIGILEALSRDPKYAEWAKWAKEQIRIAAEINGAEGKILARTVQEITGQLRRMGILDESDTNVRIKRAAEAVKLARKQRGSAVTVAAGFAILLIISVISLGCAAQDGPRLTRETIVVDEDGTEIVIEWPTAASRDPSDYTTFEIAGHMVTVAPLQSLDDADPPLIHDEE